MAQIEPKQVHLANNGSIIIRDATGKSVELPAGAAEYVLAIISGIPKWEDLTNLIDPRDVQRWAMVNALM